MVSVPTEPELPARAPRDRGRWEVLVVAMVLLAGLAFVMRRPAERMIAGPLGRSYCHEIIRCDLGYAYDECVHDVAVDTLDGRPVRDGCSECLRRAGCAGVLSVNNISPLTTTTPPHRVDSCRSS